MEIQNNVEAQQGPIQQQSSVHVVEEIPSHEIYASLLGIKRKPSLTVVPAVRSSNSYATVVVETDSIQPSTTAFGRAYAKSKEIPISSLLLDPSNKGFKLLQKMGWNESEGGLGRNRQGSLVPVTTVLKDNKKGLGAGKRKKARITHPTRKKTDDLGGVKETKAQRKRRRKAEQDRESREAKRIRMMLRTDVADEYEQLYTNLH